MADFARQLERELVVMQRRVTLPKCDVCGHDQTELGAIIFSPPNPDSMCYKKHCCVNCWNKIKFYE
jgi:hypothetical protein